MESKPNSITIKYDGDGDLIEVKPTTTRTNPIVTGSLAGLSTDELHKLGNTKERVTAPQQLNDIIGEIILEGGDLEEVHRLLWQKDELSR